jgi:Glycolipid transfer protein (GLTP)
LSDTLEKMVENEKGEKKRTATEGLLWLLRGQQFTCKSLQNAQANASQELPDAFGKAYDGTLKPFHNFIIKGVFSVGSPFSLYLASTRHLSFSSGRDESLSLSRRFLQQAEG